MTDIVREQFESEWGYTNEEQGVYFIPELNMYGSASVNPAADRKSSAWIYFQRGWHSSRKSASVTLPALREDSDADDIAGVGLVIPMFDRGYDEALEEARVAIESVGIRVEFEE